MTAGLHVVGVRHHSPACARLVRHVIATVRPRAVLIEGPADLNPRLDELRLAHRLPIAVFTAVPAERGGRSCWSPFCAWSPEWVAFVDGEALGAEVRFIDLPGWDAAFTDLRNRYADGPDRYGARVQALCRRLGVADLDAMWDHLFERPDAPEALAERLRLWFAEARGDEPGGPRDGPREAFMAAHVAHALAEGGPVVVVCGGWHAPALARVAPCAGPPPLPAPPAGAESWLVPWSYERLDSFGGYDAGMPSPAWQRAVWEGGTERAGEALLGAVARRLRAKRQQVSPADLVAARALAEGLARMRGNPAPTRVDVLDGLAGALVKDALEAPLPWNTRGVLSPHTPPLLVEVMAAFRGDAQGRLHDATPRPPLLADVARTLAAHDLAVPRGGRRVALDLADPAARARSAVLHRLRALDVPGVDRAAGPAWGTDRRLAEDWRLAWTHLTEAALIEASVWGPTLLEAAGARLRARLLAADGRLDRLAALLGEAAFADLTDLVSSVVADVARAVGREPDLKVLGAALERLLLLWRHGEILGVARSATLARVVAAAWRRGLALVEDVPAGAAIDAATVRAVVALRDAMRHAPALGLELDLGLAAFDRRAGDRAAPPALRGAALGALWSLDAAGAARQRDRAVRAVRSAARPQSFGDFLVGLFALAREPLLEGEDLLGAVEEALAALSPADFLVTLPALRLAFAWFPPGEKERLSLALARRHGAAVNLARAIEADAAVGLALDAEVARLVEAWGLEGGEP